MSRGNLNQFLLGTSVRLEHAKPKVAYRFGSNTFHLWLAGNQLDNDFIEKLVVYSNPFKKISPYVVLRYEKSFRRGLENKYMAGLGLSYQWITEVDHVVRLSANLSYDYTTFSSSDLHILGRTESANRDVLRPTFFFTGRYNIFEGNLQFSYEGWLQTATERADDYREQISLNVDNQIYKQLFTRIQLFYFSENILPIEKSRNDLRLSFGIVLKRN